MKINSISTIPQDDRTSAPNFKQMKIVKPGDWNADVLDIFVKNKEVQNLTKEWAKDGKDLGACFYNDFNKFGVTIFKDLDIVHSITSGCIDTLKKNVAEFCKKDIKVAPPRSKEAQERLDNTIKYIDEFNKSLITKPQKTEVNASGNIAAKPAKKSFLQKLFNM